MDEDLVVQIELPGRPATKKTHNQLIRNRSLILPSKQYQAYLKATQKPLQEAWAGRTAIDYGISIEARIWLNDWRYGDHCGYLQSIGDILQHWGVVTNDKWISWALPEGCHWLGVDKENPRVELTIRRLVHPAEYRAK